MTVRVMSAGMPTTRYDDQNSPILDGVGRAAQTLLELGPKLGQIKLERDRLALDQQRENRAQNQQGFEQNRQSEADQRTRVEAAPGNFTATPSPYDNALAEQTETNNATKGIRPLHYQEGLPRTPQQQVPLNGFAAALDAQGPQNPFLVTPQEASPERTAGQLYDTLGADNEQNAQSHMPTQTRAGATYEDMRQQRMAASGMQGRKLQETMRYHDNMLPIKQQMADAASDRADNVGGSQDEKYAQRSKEALAKELESIKNRYKAPSFDIRTPEEKAQAARDRVADIKDAQQRWGGSGNAASVSEAPQESNEDADIGELIKMNNARLAKPAP